MAACSAHIITLVRRKPDFRATLEMLLWGRAIWQILREGVSAMTKLLVRNGMAGVLLMAMMSLSKVLPLGMALVLLALNLITASWWPVPWTDEALFLDPAANWLMHGHFTSSLWHTQPYGEFWISNAPAYSLLLAGWLQIFGFSLEASRSLNMLLQAVLVWVCLTWAQKRLNFCPLGLVFLALFLAWPNSAAFMARNGRYDMLACLIGVLMVLCLLEDKRPLVATVAAGLSMPWVCLPALAFTSLACIFLSLRFNRWLMLGGHLGGAGLGFLTLLVFADSKIGVARFLSILKSLWLSSSDGSLDRVRLIFENLLGLAADRFWLAAAPSMLFVLLWNQRAKLFWIELSAGLRAWFQAGLIAAFACAILYKMNILYYWVLGVPLAHIAASFCQRELFGLRGLAAFILAALLLLGLPARLLIGAVQLGQTRENQEVVRQISMGDALWAGCPIVYVNWPFYYEAKKQRAITVGPKFVGTGISSDLKPLILLVGSGTEVPPDFSEYQPIAFARRVSHNLTPWGHGSFFIKKLAKGPINEVPTVNIYKQLLSAPP